MKVHHVGACPPAGFQDANYFAQARDATSGAPLACSYPHDSYVVMGRSREPERTGRVEAATESACDKLRNRAHARSASFQLASNCRAVTRCGRVQTSGGQLLNKCVHFNQLPAVPRDWGASIALLSDVETDVTGSISFRVGLGKCGKNKRCRVSMPSRKPRGTCTASMAK